jgi:hypothetical protein
MSTILTIQQAPNKGLENPSNKSKLSLVNGPKQNCSSWQTEHGANSSSFGSGVKSWMAFSGETDQSIIELHNL